VSDVDDLPFAAAPEGSVVLGSSDLDGWTDALRALYEDRARVASMGAAARSFVREWHSPEVNARSRELVYLGESTPEPRTDPGVAVAAGRPDVRGRD